MKPKMIFFDIDGTLLDEQTQTVPDSARRALRMAQEKGNLLFVNTGRTICNIDGEIRGLGFDGFVCGCGTWVELRGEKLYAFELGHEECVQIVRALRRLRISVFFEGSRGIYFDPEPCVRFEELERLRNVFSETGISAWFEESDLSHAFDKFFIYWHPESDVEGLRRLLAGRFALIDRGGDMGEIVPLGHSKATGIDLLCGRLGIPLEDCYALGDSANDLPMLRHVPGSIAMGDCAPEILPFCAYQTLSVLEDGVYSALLHFGLI